jgi:hypothetical protein
MNIALTNNLLIDLFFRDRSMARRIHATAGSLTGAKDPNEQIQWILHSEQVRYLDFRLSVVLDDNDLRLFPDDHNDACSLKGFLELVSFLTATKPQEVLNLGLCIGDPSGSDNSINRAAASAKRSLGPKIRTLSMDYSLLDLESVTVAFAQCTQAVLLHHHQAAEDHMVRMLRDVCGDLFPPVWIPREPYHRPPLCTTIFADHAMAECSPVEAAVPEESLSMFPFLGVGQQAPIASLFGASSLPLISENLAESLRRKW